jgi:hypothetical protein
MKDKRITKEDQSETVIRPTSLKQDVIIYIYLKVLCIMYKDL